MSSPSRNPNLVNLFATKPQTDVSTLNWTVDFNSNAYDEEIRSPIFTNSNKSFCLYLFRYSQIMKSGLPNSQDINHHNSYISNRHPVICLGHTNAQDLNRFATFTRISILNEKGEKCATQEGRVNFRGAHPISGGVYHFDFVHFQIDKKLTIFCEMYVLNDEQSLSDGFNGDSLIAVSNDQKTLLESGKFSDFVISVGGKEFKVHKNILASRSPVFAVMFEHTDTKEALEGRVEIENVKNEAFEQFLLYLYTGKISLLEKYAEELLELAEKYQIDSLKSLCSQQLSSTLTTDSVGKLLYLADLYHTEELKSNCVRFVKQFADKIDWDGVKLAIANCSANLGFELFKLSITKK